MQDLAPVAQGMLEEARVIAPQKVVEELATLLQGFTFAQQKYLASFTRYETKAEACRVLGISMNSVKTWRASVPGFREAEAHMQESLPGVRRELARAIFEAAAPAVAAEQVRTALQEDAAMTDRQRVVKQQAAQVVLKGAGVDEPPEGAGMSDGVERIDVLALRLWHRRKGS